jgi:dTDP-4-amino-4,6-dideoxygalactose transaminase
MKVPLMDLQSEHKTIASELLNVWEDMLMSASFIGGAVVENFEKTFAEYCETGHAIGVGNGTDALLLALKAFDIGEGDEVILPANSFVATAEAIVHARATPVFIDVDSNTYNIDVGQIERHITSKTRAIVSVHLYGQPADMDPILEIARRHNLRVIEDSAQAHGARYKGRRAGSMGDAACFSFYPAKNLGACGDGGAVVTNDAEIAERIRKFRDHGGIKKYQHDVVGYNSRLDSLQAAALLLKLKRLDERNALRRHNAGLYDAIVSCIDGITAPTTLRHVESVYHLYVIRVERGTRSALQSYLAENGVQTGIHYPAPIHRTRAFANFSSSQCPFAESNAEKIVSLPMYPELQYQQIQYIGMLISSYFGKHHEQDANVLPISDAQRERGSANVIG